MRLSAKVLLAIAGAVFALCGTSAQAAPNVVLIVTDDQRWDTLSAMPTVQSELVGKGVTFANAVVVNPLCCPSRATILTGLYSHSTGIYRNNSFNPARARRFRLPTVATWLDRAGYTTAYVGKYLNGYDGSFVPKGWDRWITFTGLADYYRYTLLRDGVRRAYGSGPAAYSTDVLAADAAAVIREAEGNLFLLFAPYAPHADISGGPPAPAPRHAGTVPVEPWRPPGVGEDLSDKPRWLRRVSANLPHAASGNSAAVRAGQLEALRAVDDAVAVILEALEETGRLADTLLIFTSDNGYTWGEHGLGNWKLVPYEESIRVPFVVRFDGRAPVGRQEPRLVANIDIAPTVAAAAGLSRTTEGRSLLPLLSGDPVPWRRDVLVEHKGEAVPTYCAVRSEPWMYAQYTDGSEELYDLAADPHQLENLAGRLTMRAVRHAQRLRLRKLCRPVPPGFVRVGICTAKGRDRQDVLLGTRWFDALCPGRGVDRVRALEGDDVIYAADRTRDYVSCGPGIDTVHADYLDKPAASCERIVRR